MATTQSSERKRRRRPADKAKPNGADSAASEELKAAKAKEVEARKAEREAEKLRKKAEDEKVKARALKALEKDAQQINARFASIERAEVRADDQRLAAAIIIAGAKERATEAKVPWKAWCEDNLKLPPKRGSDEPRQLSYRTVRLLLPIGVAESEAEGAGLKMLEDLREVGAKRQKEHRERQAAKEKAAPDEKAARKVLDDMEPKVREKFIKSQADMYGIEAGGESANMTPRDRAEKVFGKLRGRTKIAFVKWACEQVGGKLSMTD